MGRCIAIKGVRHYLFEKSIFVLYISKDTYFRNSTCKFNRKIPKIGSLSVRFDRVSRLGGEAPGYRRQAVVSTGYNSTVIILHTQLNTVQLYMVTTRHRTTLHVTTLHRTHGRKVEATIEQRTVRTKVSSVFLLFCRIVITFTLCSYRSLLYSSFNLTAMWSV